MRIAILADIHSNLTALEAVMLDIDKKGGVHEVWCLGDIVGYGPDPHECIELVKKQCSLWVAGNHDLAAIGKTSVEYFNPEAAKAVRWTGLHITEEDIHFLSNLPLTVEKDDFTLVHGSPRDPVWEYIFSTSEAEENLAYFKTRYCLIGHTHIPLIFEWTDSSTCSAVQPSDDTSFILDKKRLILNPGGVGQPRDGDPRASYAIYNDETNTVAFNRVEYDIQSTQNRMKEVRLPARLGSRLAYGY
jgi:diadenosine tetraphosphatase ApaH/serine/threonine PP2A family protein phosphatase